MKTSPPKVHVIGLLATTELAADEDRWIAADFAVFRDLFSEADTAVWLTAVDWDFPDWKPIIGDPHAQRLELPPPTPLTKVELPVLKTRFLQSVFQVAAQAQAHDTIVIVLCGHGEEDTGDIILGRPGHHHALLKEDVLISLEGVNVPSDRLFVLSVACYSGSWASKQWTLFAAAGESQTSAAMSTSASGEMRGSIFTYAILAERANAHGLTAPHPVRKQHPPDHDWRTDDTVWDLPISANMHDQNARPTVPRRSTHDTHLWMEAFREKVGGVYNDANFVVVPTSDTPCQLPTRPFTAEYLPRLHLVASSVPVDSGKTAAGAVEGRASSNFIPLSPDEKTSLLTLATAYNQVVHANVSIDVNVNALARKAATGIPLSSLEDERKLLACLRYRDRDARRAASIAKYFGWTNPIPLEKWVRGNGLDKMLLAESCGAAIATEFFLGRHVGARWWNPSTAQHRPWKTMGPGAWLADAWVRAGAQTVDPGAWEEAVRIANEVGSAELQ
ncbi:hypothetical protein B0H12DRAFT_1241716 [Mycena haematopus]|nr:hypothetical protein B0H12DRAFT_1241716 [Mycena haematopus]